MLVPNTEGHSKEGIKTWLFLSPFCLFRWLLKLEQYRWLWEVVHEHTAAARANDSMASSLSPWPLATQCLWAYMRKDLSHASVLTCRCCSHGQWSTTSEGNSCEHAPQRGGASRVWPKGTGPSPWRSGLHLSVLSYLWMLPLIITWQSEGWGGRQARKCHLSSFCTERFC